ncbi:tRNA (guanine46-N7)-methyltransferase [Aspergillus saccharolyticus JOP 1030-1]|uniref:tRNA (guanine-N(7)-)-methyltransferase n=1 Tax=Aspergillus saccharolyticus JOP 1030-1 TaxID=1450539 RepID=A0A318Z455_9EURO|nr:putative methyltransferase [Aspergillus saccharolyticus JOP 1030-1]PYH42111.1 putative methyltransferase [Aspergillus saccharolyticus JOP 1030-1]
MTPPPAKRQKRDEYRKQATAANPEGSSETGLPTRVKLPKKKFYRQRAHANPFSDHQLQYPLSPAHMDWASHFPAYVNPDPTQTNLAGTRKLLKDVEIVDIGCGFGGLLVGLAPLLPETLMVGMEIRVSVLDYLTTRIQALRAQQQQLQSNQSSTSTSNTTTTDTTQAATEAPEASATAAEEASTTPSMETDTPTETPTTNNDPNTDNTTDTTTIVPGGYQNITAIRSNTMKFFPNFFAKHQLSKIFICFPDPHFKARKHKARIVSETLNAEYAYALRPGGLLYTITDVEEYHHWVLRHFREGEDEESVHGAAGSVKELFERLTDEELAQDPCVRVMSEETEESKKVTRNKGNKYVAVFRRKEDPVWPA